MAWVLGISVSHNGAACLMRDGEIVVAVQEERLSRQKRDLIALSRRSLAVDYCLGTAGISPAQLAMVVVCCQGERTNNTPHVLLEEQLAISAHATPFKIIGHHMGHLMSALALSGYQSCAGLVIDGMGSPIRCLPRDERAVCRGDPAKDWECISLYEVIDERVRPLEKMVACNGHWIGTPRGKMRSYASLGGMYASVAEQAFGDLSKAGHVMGLAPMGRATIPVEQFFKIEDEQFVYLDKIASRFRHQDRWPYHARAYANLAASVQAALEVAIFHLVNRLSNQTRSHRLCFSGGVALNAIMNERLHRETLFEEIFIPAAAEDSGPAIGAAYWGCRRLNARRKSRVIATDGFGRHYFRSAIATAVRAVPGISARCFGVDIFKLSAERIRQGEICGWFQKGAELGPRALGNRSILADPRNKEIKDRLNRKVKHREQFRPFAPAILREHVSEWFETAKPGEESNFMLRIWPVRPERREQVPAIVHADGTARPQTVSSSEASELHSLISAFYELTGVPILVNTSFNINGEPIVETPEDALWCFLMTDLDFCVLGDIMVDKVDGRAAILSSRPRITPELGDALQTGDVLTSLNFHSKTEWGSQLRTLPGGARPFLRHVDGRRTVAEIAGICANDGLVSLEDPNLIELFAALGRMRAVEFLREGL